MIEFFDLLALVLAGLLLLSSINLIRPANGERPLLIGFMASSIFGMYIALIRLASLQRYSRHTFGIVLCIWLASKLWSIWAAALKTPTPFRVLLYRAWMRAWGKTPT